MWAAYRYMGYTLFKRTKLRICAFRRNEGGVASIETVVTLPIVLFLFFATIQVIFTMLSLSTLKRGVGDVVSTYETMFIKNQDSLSNIEIKDIICSKMVLLSNCHENIFIQLHSYSSNNLADITKPLVENTWTELDDYYVSFVRVDYKIPNIIPFFANLMHSQQDNYIISSTFTVTPSKIRFGSEAAT